MERAESGQSQPFEIHDYSNLDLVRSIKMEIRLNYFLAIETVFELMFALCPINGAQQDQFILENIKRRKDHYKEIREMAGGTLPTFLNETVLLNDGRKIPFIRYLFYGGLNGDTSPLNGIDQSIATIKTILTTVASDLSDRLEFNSYKHGIRCFRFGTNFSLHDHKTLEPIVAFDISDSMAFYEAVESDNSISLVTKVFDPARDIAMTLYCNNLISNMVMIRRGMADPKKQVAIVFFDELDFKNQSRPNVKIQNLKLSVRKIVVD
ncbi:MAG: hypothetical protein JST14_17780 [Bacteroidetes bacterium]|nr:hypothetical protein [Bacteroidota bacterium]